MNKLTDTVDTAKSFVVANKKPLIAVGALLAVAGVAFVAKDQVKALLPAAEAVESA